LGRLGEGLQREEGCRRKEYRPASGCVGISSLSSSNFERAVSNRAFCFWRHIIENISAVPAL
jgi:hypothetical protein